MFRPDLVNRDDPRSGPISVRALLGFASAFTRAKGAAMCDKMADIFVVWSSIHGMASLVPDGAAQYRFGGATPDQFAKHFLPARLQA